jgi:hypothetical protein
MADRSTARTTHLRSNEVMNRKDLGILFYPILAMFPYLSFLCVISILADLVSYMLIFTSIHLLRNRFSYV